MRGQQQGAQRLVELAPERERLGRELDLAGLHLGEVEQVVDDDEQVVGGRLHGSQPLALLLVERRLEEKLGHPEDGVHGGADLVAHVGQERVLGLVGRLGGLCAPPLRDVDHRAHDLHVARRSRAGVGDDVDVLDGSVREEEPLLRVPVSLLAHEHVRRLFSRSLPLLGVVAAEPDLGRDVLLQIEAVDVVGLLGPDDLVRRGEPAPAARVAQALGLGEVVLGLAQLAIEPRVLQRDRGLRSEEAQDGDPIRREDVRGELVLEVEHADELGLLDEREAQHRARLPAAEVVVAREGIGADGVVDDDALARPQDVAHDRVGQLIRRRGPGHEAEPRPPWGRPAPRRRCDAPPAWGE